MSRHDHEYGPPGLEYATPGIDRRYLPEYSSMSAPRSVTLAADWDQHYDIATNRANSTSTSFSSANHHHLPYFVGNDRDPYRLTSSPATASSQPSSQQSRSTLWWGDLEPWMDEEYAKQVCALMGWDPISIKVPRPVSDGPQSANNPGYCFLTFPSPSHAANVLSQVQNGTPPTMPNSSKPFVLNWASLTSPNQLQPSASSPVAPSYPKEYSIFVGDLAPETSNSDLVAVFRNPVLGLRNDREPKFIRPFLSCKSAKIMLDPVTGISRGYGFVRFTDETDQQRALIEMHGLYCLSRPMRISPATAKFKAPTSGDMPQIQFPPPIDSSPQRQSVTIALPIPTSTRAKSVSAPIAATSLSASSLHNSASGSSSSIGASSSGNTLSSGAGSSSTSSFNSTTTASSSTSEDMLNLPHHVLAQLAQQYATGEANPPKAMPYGQDGQQSPGSRYGISEESWKHHAQARAILGNLIGPNGEQLTSTDPYNTTVFVGGLSPLISEETLRTFFAPFGDIHYVKVPVGKHCGFVQFVRKADAERAIEKMQGFPVGGSRIRLSWGRSQYKAAQAAAQAAQAAAFPPQFQPPSSNALNSEQAMQLLQKFAAQGYLNPHPAADTELGYNNPGARLYSEDTLRAAMLTSREDVAHYPLYQPEGTQHHSRPSSNFSPFSPDPSVLANRREEAYGRQNEALPHPSKAYAPGFYPVHSREDVSSLNEPSLSPTTSRPPSTPNYGHYLAGSPSANSPARSEITVSRASGPAAHQSRHEIDAMHDLNGTLASLELDRPWKSPSENTDSSSASVQFQMTIGSVGSP